MLDKSKGLVLGSEQVLQGDNEASLMGTTWQNPVLATNGTVVRSTEQASAGAASAKFTSNTASSVSHYMTFGMVPAGFPVRITGRAYLPTGSLALLAVVDISDGSIIQPIVTSVKDAWVSFTITRAAKVTAWPLAIGNNANEALLGAAFYLDNISVKELPGNHAVQATTANRPIYGIHPFGGRRNLLTRTEEFDSGSWSKTGGGTGAAPTVTANAGTAPDGTTTADRIDLNRGAGNTLTDRSFVAQALTASDSVAVVGSVYLKAATSGDIGKTVAVRTASASAYVEVTLTADWVRFTNAGTTTARTLEIESRGTISGSNSVSLLAWGAQLETGSTATAYQRVTDQYNVTEAGVSSVSYLFFDGVNDSLATPTITPGVDKAQVFAGVRKLSDAAFGMIVELSAADSNNGVFYLGNQTDGVLQFLSRGTIRAYADGSTASPAPATIVLSGQGDVASDVATVRVNGTVRETVTTDQGTGTYGNYPLYIGHRFNNPPTTPSSLFFSGHLYSLIVRGASSSSILTSATEGWVASKTGVVIA
jgi:hypothetical protein